MPGLYCSVGNKLFHVWSELVIAPFLLPSLTGANWAVMGDSERTTIDRQKVVARCVGRLGGDVQQSNCFCSLLFSSFHLLLFSVFIL
jgi:hypothetical protein